MRALVVYDSFFGNTEKIALAIGEALAQHGEVSTVRVSELPAGALSGVDLLVVGSPTRAFSASPLTKGFLKELPGGGLQGVRVAAFDTRVSLEDTNSGFLRFMVKLFGYAAKPISDRLVRKGGKLASRPEGFFVGGTEGPLKEGELERAAAWAKGMVDAS